MKFSKNQHFDKALKSAKEKITNHLPLKKIEKLALNNEWFFTLVLPNNITEKIINAANSMSIKPSELVAAWISKEVTKL